MAINTNLKQQRNYDSRYLQTMKVRFDRGRHYSARLGFLILATEPLLESELMSLAPSNVGIHFARVPMPNDLTVDNLYKQLHLLPHYSGLLLPDGPLNVICYACTSGSVVMGEHQIIEQLRLGSPRPTPTTLVSCVFAAFDSLRITNLAIATPYIEDINAREAQYFLTNGFRISHIQGLGLRHDMEIAMVDPLFLKEFVISVDRPNADAVFISCSALRSMEIVDELEARLGKPVITSNQAMLWHCLRLAGITEKRQGLGRLFKQ